MPVAFKVRMDHRIRSKEVHGIQFLTGPNVGCTPRDSAFFEAKGVFKVAEPRALSQWFAGC